MDERGAFDALLLLYWGDDGRAALHGSEKNPDLTAEIKPIPKKREQTV